MLAGCCWFTSLPAATNVGGQSVSSIVAGAGRLSSGILITNLSRLTELSFQMGNRVLFDRGLSGKSRVTHNLRGYALTSANDYPTRDPRDWRLLGSDDGKTWKTLDIRRNEVFPARFERRVFMLPQEANYSIYRLQIDSVAVPASANSVQIGEIEPIYGKHQSGAGYSLAVSAQGDYPPREPVERAFDNAPETKWLSFFSGTGDRSSWVQWQYVAAATLPVFKADWLRQDQSRLSDFADLRLDGVVVSWNSASNILRLVDDTGFQTMKLAGFNREIPLGTRVRLTGRLRFSPEPLPEIENPEMLFLEAAPKLPARIVTSYAVTSAEAYEDQDPRDWRLLGSNDNGHTWALLDVQTNQLFAGRGERRVFAVKNRSAYNAYRLQVDKSRDHPGRVELAELELFGPYVGTTNQTFVPTILSASGAHPLMGPASDAFDRDPKTRWVDFSPDGSDQHWLQCQYAWNSKIVLTNVSQLVIHGMRARIPVSGQTSQILSNLTAQSCGAIRTLKGYALTSANDAPTRDARDWRLLGSNDGGKTWATVDVRRNEKFASRFERKVFMLAHEARYGVFRLQIDSVAVPAGANSVQIAEIETPVCIERQRSLLLFRCRGAWGQSPQGNR